MLHKTSLVVAFLLVVSHCGSCTFRPVVIVHGIMDRNGSLDFLAQRIREVRPGTNVTVIDRFHGLNSLLPIWKQVRDIGNIVEEISRKNPGGIHLIGYSQGGLICRGIIQSNPSINVSTFLALSSPLAGQYGDAFLHLVFPNVVKETVYRLFYSAAGQRISVANYWNDPYHQKLYLKYCKFLPLINNEVLTKNSSMYRTNFIKLRKLVLIGGPDDGVITPWQSSQFGYFNRDDVVPMQFRHVYKKDLFGLKTLDKDGKIQIFTVPGIHHTQWHHSVDVIDNYILPHLD